MEFRRIWSIPSLPLLPGQLQPEVIVSVMIVSMTQNESFNYAHYLKPFESVQKNDTINCISITYQYVVPFNCVQTTE